MKGSQSRTQILSPQKSTEIPVQRLIPSVKRPGKKKIYQQGNKKACLAYLPSKVRGIQNHRCVHEVDLELKFILNLCPGNLQVKKTNIHFGPRLGVDLSAQQKHTQSCSRRYTNGQQIHQKMFNITGHQENAN